MLRTTRALRAASVTLFTKEGCCLCDPAKYIIQKVKRKAPFDYTEVDIEEPENKKWWDLYHEVIPVVHVNGQEFAKLPIKLSEAALLKAVSDPK